MIFHHSLSVVVSLLLLLFLSNSVCIVNATIYIGGEEYQSAPALFGKGFRPPEKVITAHLQFLPHNPKLCDKLDYGNPLEGLISPPKDDDLPIVLLAERGLCSFEEKAITAMQAYPQVEYVIVFDDIPRSTLVTMGGETFDQQQIDIGLLFVSNFAGHRLQELIKNSPPHTSSHGGLKIAFDGVDPHVYEPIARIEKWILMAMGGFFTIITGFGCIIIFIQLGIIPTNASGQLIIGNTVVAQTIRTRHLLTIEEVEQIQQIASKNNNNPNRGDDDNPNTTDSTTNSNNTTTLNNDDDDTPHQECTHNHHHHHSTSGQGLSFEDVNCAICLDDFDSTSTENLYRLPCDHQFHTDCIVPWLTERHATCPLCKFDVLEYILAINSPDICPTATMDDDASEDTSDNHSATPVTTTTPSEPADSSTTISIRSEEPQLQSSQEPQQQHTAAVSANFLRLYRMFRIGWSPVQIDEAVYAAEHHHHHHDSSDHHAGSGSSSSSHSSHDDD